MKRKEGNRIKKKKRKRSSKNKKKRKKKRNKRKKKKKRRKRMGKCGRFRLGSGLQVVFDCPQGVL